jgi:hypothetical protein
MSAKEKLRERIETFAKEEAAVQVARRTPVACAPTSGDPYLRPATTPTKGQLAPGRRQRAAVKTAG